MAASAILVACGSSGNSGTDPSLESADASVNDPGGGDGGNGDGGNGGPGGNQDGGIDGGGPDGPTPDLSPLPPDMTCVPAATPDVPEPKFMDTNCDGIDGDASAAIFVATTGKDTNPGTMASPVLTITKALALAAAQSKTSVYVSKGTYIESVTLKSGISLYGGFDESMGWQRSAANVSRIQWSGTAVSATGISAETHVESLTISALQPLSGYSTYGVLVANSTGPVFLRYDQITAGDAPAGLPGTAGTAGATGPNGA
ncbi:MAG TPA: DUF1565 domain-containing protein, partial [Pseudomonadota bacterium]|nr:DUF1565 domain-containing protein [Pseudomonadota bacterium]